jgi:hypothetical protein
VRGCREVAHWLCTGARLHTLKDCGRETAIDHLPTIDRRSIAGRSPVNRQRITESPNHRIAINQPTEDLETQDE